MEFTISQALASDAFSLVSSAIATKTTVPIMSYVWCSADVKDQKVTLRANNSFLDITVNIPAKVVSGGVTCIERNIHSILGLLGDGDITFAKPQDAETFIVKKGRSIQRLSVMSPIDFPEKQEVGDYQLFNPADFVNAINRTGIAVATQAGNPVLQTFFINPHSSYVLGADGVQIALFNGVEMPGNISTPLGRTLGVVISLLKSVPPDVEVEASFGHPVTSFRTSSWEVHVQSSEVEYSEMANKAVTHIQSAMQMTPVCTVKVTKPVLQRLLSIAMIYSANSFKAGKPYQAILRHFVEKDDEVVDVLFGKRTGVYLLTGDIKNPSMESPIDGAIYEGEPGFEIWFTPAYLNEAVAKIVGDTVELRFYGSKVPFIVLDAGQANFYYLQTPIRSNADYSAQAVVVKEHIKVEEDPEDDPGEKEDSW